MSLFYRPDGSYQVDWDSFEAAITPNTRMFILCNPHNPVGKVFTTGGIIEVRGNLCETQYNHLLR